jgi:3-hydroxyisobutyrate dehydrogenase-like beta-hydroxyacid dehydrogenase
MAKSAVGLIGLGTMGGAFARHLVDAGYAVTGYDIDPKRCRLLHRHGGTRVASVGAISRGNTVIITSLPSVGACEAVFLGAGGIRDTARRGTIAIETSTMPLEVKLALRDACGARGIVVLDCPVSGTGAQAAAKDTAVYASGDAGAVERCRGVFDGFARSTHYCGEYGNGSKLKFIANLLVTIHNVAAAEAIVMGRKSGLDPALLHRVIRDGAGTSRMFEVRGAKMAAGDYANASMALGLYQKDIRIIGDFAAALNCPTPLFDASRPLYAAALAQGREHEDPAAVCAVLAQMAAATETDTRRRNARKRAAIASRSRSRRSASRTSSLPT